MLNLVLFSVLLIILSTEPYTSHLHENAVSHLGRGYTSSTATVSIGDRRSTNPIDTDNHVLGDGYYRRSPWHL